MKNAFLACVGLLVLLFAGCAQTYHFRVDALADLPLAEDRETFVLEDGFPDTPGARLRYRETADYVGRAMRARGYRPAADNERADLIVTVTADVSDPVTDTHHTLEPLYFRTWGYSEIIRTPVVDPKGNVRYVATRIYVPPETHFAGYTGRERSVVLYQKELELTARTPEGDEVWTVRVATLDRDSDLRASIPYLAAAATPYLGEVTEGAVAVGLKEDDEMLEHLRGLPTREELR